MRIIYLLLFFITFPISAQIELKIDSITSTDSIPSERKFTVNYHIKNLTDKEVSFFFDSTILIPNQSASMSKHISYKLFQKEEVLNISGLFMTKKLRNFSTLIEQTINQKEKDSIILKFMKDEIGIDMKKDIEELKKDENYFLKKSNKELLESIFKLNPYQKITFTKTLNWDKKRYYKIEEDEYYINEDMPHYLELSINLIKEGFKEQLEKKEFEKIMANPNFIKGWFTSNKMELNFKE